MEMVLRVEYYDDNKLKELIKKLNKNNISFEYVGDKQDNTIDIYGLVNFSNSYRNLQFYVEFYNKNNELKYFDITENEIARYTINLF